MTHVLTLIAASPGHLDETLVSRVREKLPDRGAPDWLSAREACDLPFELGDVHDRENLRNVVQDAIGRAPVDVVLQREQDRRKGLLVADMDSTLIGQECIDELADFAGLKTRVADITERAMRGELEFEPALRERVALLEGLDESVLHEVFEERITLNPGARTLARTMRAYGAKTLIVSGGFTFFTERVADAAGFEVNQANTLEVSSGKLTGRVIEPILGQQAKLDALREYRDGLSLRLSQTIAVGDGANDLAMLEEAGLGVAYRAKPIVAQRADAGIEHADLTALLFAQGFQRDEFSED
ncbi:MAG: phosphoserine phosphatase SerB [Hyphomicrobiaceae bacterium]|nr:phosphoserine phosphatase SerB [Hyphomicrobiaceae bacterium]